MQSKQCRVSREAYLKRRKKAHDAICPPRKIAESVVKLRELRLDIKNRKVATCLGCGRPNWDCRCYMPRIRR